MTLGKLIEYLEEVSPNIIAPIGFSSPHSYRGYYDQLAFVPRRNVTVGKMLADAKYAVGKTFTGWKGGEYKMDLFTDVWLAFMGCSGESIGSILLAYMCGQTEKKLEDEK